MSYDKLLIKPTCRRIKARARENRLRIDLEKKEKERRKERRKEGQCALPSSQIFTGILSLWRE
jgi:hypothetical protein